MTRTSDRFQALIDAYGARPDRWPLAERTAALVALASLPKADENLRAAQTLDALLDAWRLDPPTEGLAGAITARAIAQRGPVARRAVARLVAPNLPRRAWTWMSSAGLAAACAAGVLVGVRLGDPSVARPGDTEAAGSLLDSGATAFGVPTDLEKTG